MAVGIHVVHNATVVDMTSLSKRTGCMLQLEILRGKQASADRRLGVGEGDVENEHKNPKAPLPPTLKQRRLHGQFLVDWRYSVHL